MNSDKSQPKQLFSQLQLPAPDSVSVEHEVSAAGELVGLVTWSNDGVSIDGETLPDNEDVFTIIEIWQQGDIVHTQNATLDDGRMEVSLADASWVSVLHLSTATVSYQGDRSTGLHIFAGVRLAPPDNIRISYTYEGGELVAVLEWDNMMGASFRGLHTLVTVYTEAATTEDATEAEARVRRSNDVPYSHRVPYTQT